MAGDSDRARTLARLLPSPGCRSEVVIDAWDGDALALANVRSMADARPDDLALLGWAARLSDRIGDRRMAQTGTGAWPPSLTRAGSWGAKCGLAVESRRRVSWSACEPTCTARCCTGVRYPQTSCHPACRGSSSSSMSDRSCSTIARTHHFSLGLPDMIRRHAATLRAAPHAHRRPPCRGRPRGTVRSCASGPTGRSGGAQIVPDPVAFLLLYAVGWVVALALNGLYRPRARWSIRTRGLGRGAGHRAHGRRRRSRCSSGSSCPTSAASSCSSSSRPSSWSRSLTRAVLRLAFRHMRTRGMNGRFVLVAGRRPTRPGLRGHDGIAPRAGPQGHRLHR